MYDNQTESNEKKISHNPDFAYKPIFKCFHRGKSKTLTPLILPLTPFLHHRVKLTCTSRKIVGRISAHAF